MAKTLLITCPHAGAIAGTYTGWNELLGPAVELRQIGLPGRGRRWNEPLPETMHDVVEDAWRQIQDDVDRSDYALFGLSMGALIAFELCLKIQALGGTRPCHVFLSGSRAPHLVRRQKKKLHQLPDETLLQEVRRLGGLSDTVLDSKPLLDFVLPVIRNDLRLVETYEAPSTGVVLDVDTTLIRGAHDEVTRDEMKAWNYATRCDGRYIELDGGHFCVLQQARAVVDLITGTLACGETKSGSRDLPRS